MAWFRMYEEVLNDPKVQKLPPDLFKAWVNLLCLAKRCDGVLPPLDEVSFALRASEEETDSILELLVSSGLFDVTDDGLTPHNWDKRQFRSDTSNERVARYRERRKRAGLPGSRDLRRFRKDIEKRDGPGCAYCGETDHAVIHHMIPVHEGGGDELDNLCLACKSCALPSSGMEIKSASAIAARERHRKTVTSNSDKKHDVTVTPEKPTPDKSKTYGKKNVTVTGNASVTPNVTGPESESESESDTESESGKAPSAPTYYVFEGEIIKLRRKEYMQWEKIFPHITNLQAKLQRIDDFFVNRDSKRGQNWFTRTSLMLEKDNEELAKLQTEEDYGTDPLNP
jgi:5-methylcytosine-specific restriction endonuclease McrA